MVLVLDYIEYDLDGFDTIDVVYWVSRTSIVFPLHRSCAVGSILFHLLCESWGISDTGAMWTCKCPPRYTYQCRLGYILGRKYAT